MPDFSHVLMKHNMDKESFILSFEMQELLSWQCSFFIASNAMRNGGSEFICAFRAHFKLLQATKTKKSITVIKKYLTTTAITTTLVLSF
jgi:hypothetical protein